MISKDVQNAIQSIYDRDGKVVPTAVVNEAKRADSALHNQFEWDDSKAAHSYRLVQARTLIRRVRIVTTETDEPERLVHVPEKSGEGAYKPTSALVKSKTEFELALDEALRRLHSARLSVDELKSAVEASNDDALARIVLACEALSTANEALRSVH
jgi:hypothetical protein